MVDIKNQVIAAGGELHVDEEQLLLDLGSTQSDLWGINLYLQNDNKEDRIEFDSMINLRVRDGNKTRGVDDPIKREKIKQIVYKLIQD